MITDRDTDSKYFCSATGVAEFAKSDLAALGISDEVIITVLNCEISDPIVNVPSDTLTK